MVWLLMNTIPQSANQATTIPNPFHKNQNPISLLP